ncbi:MAG: lysostaphin resistance A-like protein [Phycisphaerae bacterium]
MSHALLSTIDQAVTLCAVLILAVFGVWWVLVSRRDPLAGAPQRANTIRDDALVFVLVVYLLGALVAQKVSQLLVGGRGDVFVNLMAGSGAQLVGIGACLTIASLRFEGGIAAFCLGTSSLRRGSGFVLLVGGTVVALGLCPIVLEASMALVRWLAPLHELRTHPTIEALHYPDASLFIKALLWIGACVIAPVAEELFFRGLLQTFLVNLLRNRWLAMSLAPVAFSVVHMSQEYAIPALAVLAMLIGYLYERSGSLLLPVLVHAAFNTKTLVWDLLASSPGQ